MFQLEGAVSAKALRQERTGTSRGRQQGGRVAEQREGREELEGDKSHNWGRLGAG